MSKSNKISRRKFMQTSAATSAGVMLAGSKLAAHSGPAGKRRKFAIVGTGSRSRMYERAILEHYQDSAELVGLCDPNAGRLGMAQAWAKRVTGKEVPGYHSNDFDKMIADTKPDAVIVTTVDGYHHQYIIRAMELGCDAITEKPMTIDAEKCQDIINTQKKTGKHCTVTFNYRYSPPRTQVKDLLMNGEIGDVLSVDFHWMLNTHHGADYFRRWHSQKKFSGGLMVHKSTHHFDLVNWWLSAIPVTVYANGKRDFYTPKMAKRLGLDSHHERCQTCPEKAKCGFELDLSKSRGLKALYLDHEKHDGYYRDRCVFRPDIDIEDTMNVIVKYDNDVTMSYSLNAFNSWEGYYVIFNGTEGRIEHRIEERIYVSGTDTVQGGLKEGGTRTRVVPLRGPARDLDPWTGTGGHGGGDRILLDSIFAAEKQDDKYKRPADHRSGAYSILTGVAANIAIDSGKQVQIADLVQGVGYPEYTPMPNHDDPVPMPAKRA